MVNELVTAPLVLSTLIAHPLEPPLGAVMAQGPITYGLPGVPFPAVTDAHPPGEPGAVKSEFAVMVIAACCPLPALAATGMLTAKLRPAQRRRQDAASSAPSANGDKNIQVQPRRLRNSSTKGAPSSRGCQSRARTIPDVTVGSM